MDKVVRLIIVLLPFLSFGQIVIPEPVPIYANKVNWTSYISYDLSGITKTKGINFFNELGKTTQQQKWDILTQRLWNSEVKYDNFNRPAIQSLSAPINQSGIYGFNLITNFISINNGSNNVEVGLDDFDSATNLFDPPMMSTDINTLGWYYSTANSYDLYQDVTSYPYSRTVYSILNPGKTLAVLGGKKVTINGESKWLQTYSFQMPLENSNGDSAFYSNFAGKKVNKTISRDVNGVETVVYIDTDGNVLGSSKSGYECTHEQQSQHREYCLMKSVYSEILDNGFVDIHIPEYCQGISIDNPNGTNSNIRVFDLITEQEVTTSLDILPHGFYRIEDQSNYYGNNNSSANPITPIKIYYQVNYYDLATNQYDEAGRIRNSKQIIGLESNYTYDSYGELLTGSSVDQGTTNFKYRDDGQIRFSQNSEQLKVGSFSYTNYDHLGRPIESGVYKGSVLFASLDDSMVNQLDGLPLAGRSEQQFTRYDSPDPELLRDLIECRLPYPDYTQTFLAGNVSYTYTQNPTTSRTWYSYDVFGRVIWVIQKMSDLGCLKTLEYQYDPINGQLVSMIYQKHGPDLFVHSYKYDNAGQLTDVSTSTDNVSFTQQAHYIYNDSGALVRTELAHNLQGIDYTYNLNGQLKAINHPSLKPVDDPGNDGNNNGSNGDVFGMAIDYCDDDYSRPNTPTPITTSSSGINQYNGNIKATRWNNTQIVSPNTYSAYLYNYNKQNWLTNATFGSATSSSLITPDPRADYKEGNISYDPNGNILKLTRNGYTDTNGSNNMDKFQYVYEGNRLKYVKDYGDNSNPNRYNDLRDQEVQVQIGTNVTSLDNYLYNDLGQLVFNLQDRIGYQYYASGLVSKITTTTSSASNAAFVTLENLDYSQTGSSDSEVHKWSSGLPKITTAIGTVGHHDMNCSDIGTYQDDLGLEFLGTGTSLTKFRVMPGTFTKLDLDVLVDNNLYNTAPYETSDPLNSTLDAQQNIPINPNITIILRRADNSIIATQTIDVNTAAINSYCNGHLRKHHVHFDYTTTNEEFVTLEITRANAIPSSTTIVPRLQQRIVIDNVILQAATQTKVAFEYNERGQRVHKQTFQSGNTTLNTYYVRDLSGNPMGVYTETITNNIAGPEQLEESAIYGLGRVGIVKRNTLLNGVTFYEITDHLGNVRAVISRFGATDLALTSKTDYYPFGMPMPNLQVTDNNYRYAFQGQEKDPETGMEAFDLRLWDARLGRWLTVDPAGQYDSPYIGMGNNPIGTIDPDGGEDWHYDAAGNLVADKGDNASTLATFLHCSLDHAEDLMSWNDFSTVKEGDTMFPMIESINEIIVRGKPAEHYYFDSYFKYYQNNPGPNPYSPYIPDASGFSVNVHVKTGLFGEFYLNGGFASDSRNNIALFGGYGGNFGFNGTLGKPEFGLGLSYDMHDNYGGNKDVLGGLGGYNKGYFGGLGLTGSHSRSAKYSPKLGKYLWDDKGVSTTSIGLSFGWGAGMGISNSRVIKF